MPVRRHFIGSSEPTVQTVAAHVLAHHGAQSDAAGPAVLDLSDLVIAVPTSRFGRRLLEILAESSSSPVALVPPTVVPISALHHHLGHPARRRATDTEVLLAWIAAMRAAGPDVCSEVWRAVSDQRVLPMAVLAEQLAAVHRVLSAAGLTMETAASEVAGSAPGTSRRRWHAMVQIEQAFGEALARAALSDPAAIEAATEATVIIADVPEIPEALCRALDTEPIVAEILIGADASESALFDTFGRPLVEAWHDREVPVPDQAIITAQGLPDQAAAVLRFLEDLAGRFGQDDVSVALGDPSMESVIKEVFAAAGVRTHSAFPRSLARSRPATLLAAACDYLDGFRSDALARLARHPDLDTVAATIASSSPGLALMALDRWRSERLPTSLRLDQQTGQTDLDGWFTALGQVLPPLTDRKRPLHEWARPIVQVLTEAYKGILPNEPGDSSRVSASLDLFGDLLREVSVVDERLSSGIQLTGTEAVRLLLRRATAVSQPDIVRESAVELLNWFELAHDDAPIKVVLGMNDGYIPENAPDDPLLPDAVRCALGLPSSRSRQARDVYYLRRLVASTAHLALVVGKQSASGDPLRPSRLLFFCPANHVATRALRLFDPTDSGAATVPYLYDAATRFGLPRPRTFEPLRRMSVTSFADYLRCPYRFYLRHVLGLDSDEDELPEMDALVFGSLIHEALGLFGTDPAAASTDEDAVIEALVRALERVASRRFGKDPPPAVNIQLGLAETRLRAFARWQAGRTSEGWSICPDLVEVEAEKEIVVDGDPIVIHGRIDRIDRHEASGAYAIFDYKTGDQPMTPEKVHRPSQSNAYGWSDLQLPLYRRIAPVPSGSSVSLGYLWIGPDLSQSPLCVANWSDADLASADACTEKVIRAIRQGIFWPPNPDLPPAADGIGAICMDACAERLTLLANPEPHWDAPGTTHDP